MFVVISKFFAKFFIATKAELTFKPNFERIELPYIECVNAVALIVADPHSGNVANFTPYWAK